MKLRKNLGWVENIIFLKIINMSKKIIYYNHFFYLSYIPCTKPYKEITMTPTNRTIEEKLAIVQQLKSNSNAATNTKINAKTAQNQPPSEESGPFLAFLIIRLVICVLIFGVIAFIGSKNPAITQYVNTMITTEENGNLIDFMSPFTYTLQENVESVPEADAQESESIDSNAPSAK